jgi:hypothetical protein
MKKYLVTGGIGVNVNMLIEAESEQDAIALVDSLVIEAAGGTSSFMLDLDAYEQPGNE